MIYILCESGIGIAQYAATGGFWYEPNSSMLSMNAV